MFWVFVDQALQFEVGNLGFAMKNIHDAVSLMDEEVRIFEL